MKVTKSRKFILQFIVDFERDAENLSSFHLHGTPYEPITRKPVFGVSDQVRHKADSTATEDDCLEISDFLCREIVLSM